MLRSQARPAARSLVVPIIFFAVLTALTARITIPLPFSVVPITLQTFAVLLSGLVLGSRGGALSQILYLGAIAAGLPISAAGLAGPAAFVTPTAGYLVAFVPAAFVAGYLLERRNGPKQPTLPLYMLAGVCGMLVIYAGGVAWLTLFLGNFQVALQQGLFPFIGVDLGKAVLAALITGGGRMIFAPTTL